MKGRRNCLSLLLGMLFVLCAAGAACAAESKSVPTSIKASQMQYDATGQRVLFEGAVHVARPDFELWADVLTVHLDKARQGNATNPAGLGMDAGQISRIVAERNVRMKQANRSATCGKATYTAFDGKIVLERNPVVQEGANQIRGNVINFYTRDNRSEVIGTVEAHFVTPDKNGGVIPGRTGQKTRDESDRAGQKARDENERSAPPEVR